MDLLGKKKNWILLLLSLSIGALLVFGLGSQFLKLKNKSFALPQDEYWDRFLPLNDLRTVEWLNTSSFDEWTYQAKEGEALRMKRHLAAPGDLSLLKQDWENRTNSLQTYSIDPYFPAITKEGECDKNFKPNRLSQSNEISTIYTLGAGKNFTAGACGMEEIKYRMIRRIFTCDFGNYSGALYVADLYIDPKKDLSQAIAKLSGLPCFSNSP